MAWHERFGGVGRRIGLRGTAPAQTATVRDAVKPASDDTENRLDGPAQDTLVPPAEATATPGECDGSERPVDPDETTSREVLDPEGTGPEPDGEETTPWESAAGEPVDAPGAETSEGLVVEGDDEWLRWALLTYPQPEYPLEEDWSVSVAALLAKIPRFPRFAVRLLGVLDRFGAVRIGPQRLGFDGSELDWDRVTEIRLHNPADLLTEHVLEEELKRLLWIVPPVPGRRWLLRRVGRLVLTMYLIVEGGARDLLGAKETDDVSDGLPAGVPAEIVYRRRLLGTTSQEAGLVSVLLLALMPRTKEVIHQIAQERGIPFVAAERDGTLTASANDAEAVRGRVGGLWRRWSGEVAADSGPDEGSLEPHELEPATEGETREALTSRPTTDDTGDRDHGSPAPGRS